MCVCVCVYRGASRPCVCSGEQMGVGMLVCDVNGDPMRGATMAKVGA